MKYEVICIVRRKIFSPRFHPATAQKLVYYFTRESKWDLLYRTWFESRTSAGDSKKRGRAKVLLGRQTREGEGGLRRTGWVRWRQLADREGRLWERWRCWRKIEESGDSGRETSQSHKFAWKDRRKREEEEKASVWISENIFLQPFWNFCVAGEILHESGCRWNTTLSLNTSGNTDGIRGAKNC